MDFMAAIATVRRRRGSASPRFPALPAAAAILAPKIPPRPDEARTLSGSAIGVGSRMLKAIGLPLLTVVIAERGRASNGITTSPNEGSSTFPATTWR
jgi:hypothetical protein